MRFPSAPCRGAWLVVCLVAVQACVAADPSGTVHSLIGEWAFHPGDDTPVG
jgi:hypothetical protein